MTQIGDAIVAAQAARKAGQPPPPLPVDACIELYTEVGPRSKIRMLNVLASLFDHPHEEIAKALKQRGIYIRRHDRELLKTREGQDIQRLQHHRT